VHNPNGKSIGSAVFTQLTSVYRQNRQHVNITLLVSMLKWPVANTSNAGYSGEEYGNVKGLKISYSQIKVNEP